MEEKTIITSENQVSEEESRKEKGASLVEYALLVALIAVACIVAIRALGSKISQQFSYTGAQL